jgi:hypothetical protein
LKGSSPDILYPIVAEIQRDVAILFAADATGRGAIRPATSADIDAFASHLVATTLSLRFKQEEFCDELYVHRKTLRLLFSRIQAAVLIAG